MTEAVGRLLLSRVSESDEVALAESLNLLITTAGVFYIPVSDTVAIAEQVSALVPLAGIQETDAVAVAESVATRLSVVLAVSDAVSVADIAAVILLLAIVGAENVSVTEAVDVAAIFPGLFITDSIAVVDSPTLSLPGVGSMLLLELLQTGLTI